MYSYLSECGEECNSPDGSPSPHTGQTSALAGAHCGHMETLNRSSSTDFLLLLYSEHSPFRSLDIKTYGSHYLQIGSKGRRRRREMGRSVQNITNCIPAEHKVRRHGADDRVGGRYPDGEQHNGESESRRPSILAWARRSMENLFG